MRRYHNRLRLNQLTNNCRQDGFFSPFWPVSIQGNGGGAALPSRVQARACDGCVRRGEPTMVASSAGAGLAAPTSGRCQAAREEIECRPLPRQIGRRRCSLARSNSSGSSNGSTRRCRRRPRLGRLARGRGAGGSWSFALMRFCVVVRGGAPGPATPAIPADDGDRGARRI